MVIPIHDINPTRRTPWVTYALIAVNAGVFLATPAVGLFGLEGAGPEEVCAQQAFYWRYGAIPGELIDNEPEPFVPTGQVGIGPSGLGCVLGPPTYDKNPVVSVLTAMFLHGGWLHLIGNMLFLFIFGNNVEDRMGRLRFLAFYLFAGYVATYGFALANSGSMVPLVGASGAVAGVLGAYIVLYPRARVLSLVPFLLFLPLPLPAWIVLGTWFLLQWLYSSGTAVGEGSVAYLAHVLGFLAGVILALPLRRRRDTARGWPPPTSPGPISYRG